MIQIQTYILGSQKVRITSSEESCRQVIEDPWSRTVRKDTIVLVENINRIARNRPIIKSHNRLLTSLIRAGVDNN